ncbi:MAG: hypothetical protein SWH61_16250 [Thermodesulfobacteriota bacterium]|nr:hypothetical protein [Thermodesulfobacteriota bacterium]
MLVINDDNNIAMIADEANGTAEALSKSSRESVPSQASGESGRRAEANPSQGGSKSKSIDTEKLQRAWEIAARSNASSPGKHVAYYSLDVDGCKLSGERPWEKRWGYIGRVLREAAGGDLKNKKILELGCNLGLLSTWAAREGAICNGYEYAGDILEGSALVAEAFGVGDRCTWRQIDLNDPNQTRRIRHDYDLCTCLSVMNWVKNKDNLIELLSTQKSVLFEGHDSDEIEIDRLKKAGFFNIDKVATSERKRSIFLATRTAYEQTGTWEEIEQIYGLKGIPFETPRVKIGDGNTAERIYLKKPEVWKIRLSNRKNPAKLASPYQEAKLLQMLSQVPHICRFREYVEKPGHTILKLVYYPNIGKLNQVRIPEQYRAKVQQQRRHVIQSVNDHGILHNDINSNNFLVNANYDICLIDFDQAQIQPGKNDYEHGRYSSCNQPLIGEEPESSGDMKIDLLRKAWEIAADSKASSPEKHLAYYALTVKGHNFPGERDWSKRWRDLKTALHQTCSGGLTGKRILELRCNMGLLSIWAAREGAVCHGYDNYPDILKAASMIAKAYQVDDKCNWKQVDINDNTEPADVFQDFDVCICLSAWKWTSNKENLLKILSLQKAVIYEGHDEDVVETERLQKAGFTRIEKIAVSDRKRSILLAERK